MQKSLLKWFKSKENKIESKSTSISSLAPKILTYKKDIKKADSLYLATYGNPYPNNN